MRKSSLPALCVLVISLLFYGCGQKPSESSSFQTIQTKGDLKIKLSSSTFCSSKGQHLKFNLLILDKEGKELPLDGRDINFTFQGKKVFPSPVKGFFSGETFYISSGNEDEPAGSGTSSRWTYVTSSLPPGEYRGEIKAKDSTGEGFVSFTSTVASREKWVESRPANLVFYHGIQHYPSGRDEHYVGAYVEWDEIPSPPGSTITSYSVLGIKESEHIGFGINTTGRDQDKLGPLCLAALARLPALCARWYSAGDNWQDTENELRQYYAGWVFTVIPNFDKELVFENIKIEPNVMPRGETTTITAHINYSPSIYWAPEDIRWEVFIYKEDSPGIYAVIGSGDGESVSFAWDGQTMFSSGPHPAPCGRYFILIGAQCSDGAYGS